MHRTLHPVPLITSVLFLINSCSLLLYRYAIITGKVRLSDNPPGGHGGVVVSTNAVSTHTGADGKFTLEGNITTGNVEVFIHFQKDGYESMVYELDIPSGTDTVKIDIGTIVLQKMPGNIFGDFNDGNADGGQEDTLAIYCVENGGCSIGSGSVVFSPGQNIYFHRHLTAIQVSKQSKVYVWGF